MRFMLLMCGGPDAGEHAADPAMARRCEAWAEDLVARGITASGTGLQPPADARTLRMRAGQLLLTDGPFAETKEQIGGFTLLECADHDEAVRAAAAHPWAEYGSIEVRELAHSADGAMTDH